MMELVATQQVVYKIQTVLFTYGPIQVVSFNIETLKRAVSTGNCKHFICGAQLTNRQRINTVRNL